jgi:hypothetical protein
MSLVRQCCYRLGTRARRLCGPLGYCEKKESFRLENLTSTIVLERLSRPARGDYG